MKIDKTELTNGKITLRTLKTEDLAPCFEAARESINLRTLDIG